MALPKDANILFLCLGGYNRSPYAVDVAEEYGYNYVKSGGANPNGSLPTTQNDIDWAEHIICLDDLVVEFLYSEWKVPESTQVHYLYVPENINYFAQRSQIEQLLLDNGLISKSN